MDGIMLTIKELLFLALELIVVGVAGAALVLGVYQIVRDGVRASRRVDEVAPDLV